MDPWLKKGAENTPLAGGFRARHAYSVVVNLDVGDSQQKRTVLRDRHDGPFSTLSTISPVDALLQSSVVLALCWWISETLTHDFDVVGPDVPRAPWLWRWDGGSESQSSIIIGRK